LPFTGIHAPPPTQSPYGDDGDGGNVAETSFPIILKESGAEVNGKKKELASVSREISRTGRTVAPYVPSIASNTFRWLQRRRQGTNERRDGRGSH
jgi:hypothetical protein